ncbi:hypothetical protein FQN50_003994 [Emmonsiellopsis sp. PD_5]|nr:hypothetical protein FQN50_003994 [Emmonsiellopsis sp. PD_5]
MDSNAAMAAEPQSTTMLPLDSARQQLEALQLPGPSDQKTTMKFLEQCSQLFQELESSHASSFNIASLPVAYMNATKKKAWLEKTRPSKEDSAIDPLYDLGICSQAVTLPKMASRINYWLCYCYSSLIWESSTQFLEMKAQNATPEEMEVGKAIHSAGGGIWHAILVKSHNGKFYVYDSDLAAPEQNRKKRRLKDVGMNDTVRNLVLASRKRCKVSEVLVTKITKDDDLGSERACCQALRDDLLSYLEEEDVDKTTVSQKSSQMAWESVNFTQ